MKDKNKLIESLKELFSFIKFNYTDEKVDNLATKIIENNIDIFSLSINQLVNLYK